MVKKVATNKSCTNRAGGCTRVPCRRSSNSLYALQKWCRGSFWSCMQLRMGFCGTMYVFRIDLWVQWACVAQCTYFVQTYGCNGLVWRNVRISYKLMGAMGLCGTMYVFIPYRLMGAMGFCGTMYIFRTDFWAQWAYVAQCTYSVQTSGRNVRMYKLLGTCIGIRCAST
jgi:hypothetical protein